MERCFLQRKSNALFWLLTPHSCHMSYFMLHMQLATAGYSCLDSFTHQSLLENCGTSPGSGHGRYVAPQWCWWQSTNSFGISRRFFRWKDSEALGSTAWLKYQALCIKPLIIFQKFLLLFDHNLSQLVSQLLNPQTYQYV